MAKMHWTMTSRMTVFLVLTIVGVLMAALPYFVFGSGDDAADVAAAPFWPPLMGIVVAAVGAAGFLHAWWLKRRGLGEGMFAVHRDDSDV